MEEEETDGDGRLQRAKMADGAPPQLLDCEFRQPLGPKSSVSGDQNALPIVPQSEYESRVMLPPAPSGSMKRRNSNLANCEKVLQEMNASSNNAGPSKRKENAVTYATILEVADEVHEEDDGENGKKAQGDQGEKRSAHQTVETECEGDKKPTDRNQALLHYFIELSSADGVEDSLGLEQVRSLLRAGASVNTCDRFGQTLLHEVSRTWGVDVAQFFIEQGKKIKLPSLQLVKISLSVRCYKCRIESSQCFYIGSRYSSIALLLMILAS